MSYYYLKKQDYIDTYNNIKKNKIKIKLKNKFLGFLEAMFKKFVPIKIKEILKQRRYRDVKQRF